MKRLILLLAVMGTTLALAAGMALAQATTDRYNVKVSFDEIEDPTIFNSCTDEPVLLTGELHFLITQTEDANGGLYVQEHAQAQGVSGTGLESGTQYRLVGVSRQEDFYFAPGERREVTVVNESHIISKGSSDNLLTHCTIHMTFNANGEPTAELTQIETECAG